MSDKNIVLYVARHGRTVMNEENKFRGDADPSLDKNGFKDANELAFWFSNIELSFIVASSKRRALSTAEVVYLGKQTNPDECAAHLKPYPNDLLYPWNVGDFGGLPKNEENKARLQFYVDNPSICVPGGTSLNEFKCRVHPLFQEAAEEGERTGVPGLLVVHSSVIHEIGEYFGEHHEDAHVKPGGVAAVYVRNGYYDVEPIFKPDQRASTQNILGTDKNRSGLSS